jgi:hypothetical protein
MLHLGLELGRILWNELVCGRNRENWRIVVKTGMNLRLLNNSRRFVEILASEERLWSVTIAVRILS